MVIVHPTTNSAYTQGFLIHAREMNAPQSLYIVILLQRRIKAIQERSHFYNLYDKSPTHD
jgi:hypothetical protein